MPAVSEKVVGPFTLDMAAAGCDADKINKETQKKLESQGLVKGEDYDSLSIIHPSEKTGCKWSGLGSVPGPFTWVNQGGSEVSSGLLVHEFGHNQGLGHHARLRCTDGNLQRCAEDGFSSKTPMGGGGAGVGLTAPELIHTGRLPTQEHARVEKSGTFTLHPLYGESAGLRALDIPMGDDRLVLEYRQPSGPLDSRVRGVHAYRVTDGKYQKSALIDPALKDATGRIEVKVVSTEGGKATVPVSLDGVPAPAEARNTASAGRPAPGPAAAEGKNSRTGAPASEKGTDAWDDSKKAEAPRPQAADTSGHKNLAQTGGDSDTALLMGATGATLVAAGAGAVILLRTRRTKRH